MTSFLRRKVVVGQVDNSCEGQLGRDYHGRILFPELSRSDQRTTRTSFARKIDKMEKVLSQLWKSFELNSRPLFGETVEILGEKEVKKSRPCMHQALVTGGATQLQQFSSRTKLIQASLVPRIFSHHLANPIELFPSVPLLRHLLFYLAYCILFP